MSCGRVADDVGASNAFEAVGQETAQQSEDYTSQDCEDEEQVHPRQVVDDDDPESAR